MYFDLSTIFNELLIYNSFLLIGFLWFFAKYKKNSTILLLTTLVFGGLFMDLGNILIPRFIFGSIRHLYVGTLLWQVGTLVWSLKLFLRHSSLGIIKKNKLLVVLFLVYCLVFILSSIIINEDSILLSVRQLSKDLIPFFLYFVLSKLMQDHNYASKLNLFFFRLINAQIIFNIIKFLILIERHEGLVGSLTGIHHGGPGTSFPLLGLIFIAINSKMSLKKRDLWMILGLLFIGLMAGKRAVWLLFPALFFLLSLYVYRQNVMRKLITIAIFLPFVFYLGLRLTPSLNPENAVWGSFDPEYAWSFALRYSAGIEDDVGVAEIEAGRIGALVLAYEKIANSKGSKEINRVLWGYGHEYFVVHTQFYSDRDYWWGIGGRGSITEVLVKIFSIGLIAAILYITYIILMLSKTKNTKLKHVIIFLALFDFVFYNGTILTHPGLFALLLFMVLYEKPKTCRLDPIYSR